jgi:hypothetical protein
LATEFDKECFFIAPIGESDSEARKRSNGVRDWVVRPAALAAAGLNTVRADDVGEPGQITAQAVQHCLKAKAAVADLTGGNPNVYYELSVRHGALLPVVLIAEDGTKLPFDISQSRVIFFDHTDLSSAGRARERLQEQIEASLTGIPDNPISDGMRLAELQSGNVEEQTLAVLLDRIERLSHSTEQIDRRLRRSEENPTDRQEIGRPLATPIITEWTTVDDNGVVRTHSVIDEEKTVRASLHAKARAEARERREKQSKKSQRQREEEGRKK